MRKFAPSILSRRRVAVAGGFVVAAAALLLGAMAASRSAGSPTEVWIVGTDRPGDMWSLVPWEVAREIGGPCDPSLEVVRRDPREGAEPTFLLHRAESRFARWVDDSFGTDWASGEILGRWRLVGEAERWNDGRWGWRAVRCEDQQQFLRRLPAEEREDEAREATAAARDPSEEE